MSQKIVVGPINKGLRTDRLPFNIDNDSFPTLINAYQWRGRIKRKRGTSLLGRLQRYFDSTLSPYTGKTTNPSFTITFDGSGNANLLGPYTNATPVSFSLQSNGNIVPGTVSIVGSVGPVTYTDPTMDGYLTPTGTGGANTINYATGAIHIPAQAGGTATAHFRYYPDLPVMGLEDLVLNANLFPGTIAFDTTYSYNINTMFPYPIYDVSFYKNPPASASLPGYVAKTIVTPLTWNGQNYQQFWTTNYEGAMWATNGINVPFTGATIGMQFQMPASATQTSATTVNFVIADSPLVIGDFVFANEFTGTSGSTLNFQTGYVTGVTGTTYTVTFPNATIGGAGLIPGILQYLTTRSNPAVDCIRWYDGDPTNGNPTTPTLNGQKGWVNFMPPISQSALTFGTPDDIPPGQYYLVGCRMIVPYKDRLLFIGPVVQTSSVGATPLYLQDTVIYSENGTPYYTASFTGSVSSPTTTFNPILTPLNQGAVPGAYFSDQTGFGGFITAGHARPIITAGFNEDVLILGFSNRQTRFLYTGNDLVPFNFYTVNSEFGSTSTFSAITLDRAVLSIGNNGIIAAAQIGAERIDLEILDQIFQFSLSSNGTERVTAQRDFINEWIYFTYRSRQQQWVFPNQTLLYNYRDKTWAIFNEAYTTYGQFRKSTGLTWSNVGMYFPTWAQWNQPWSASTSNVDQPVVICGNQQGFVFFRESVATEAQSLYIQSYSGQVVTSPAHTLNDGDYITITINSVLAGIYQVSNPTTDTFTALGPTLPTPYFGLGTIQRMYVPYIQSKEFPVSWGMGRKTRIGPQMYLLSNTDVANSQITLLIFLSEGSTGQFGVGPAYNNLEFPLPGQVLPQPNTQNDALIYSTVLYTSPEYYIQTSKNISLGNIGDGAATTITLNLQSALDFTQVIVAGSVLITIGSLATFQDNGSGGFTVTGTGVSSGSSIVYTTGIVTLVFSVAPPSTASKINISYYILSIQSLTAQTQNQIWHRMNTSLIGDTVQVGFTMNSAQMLDTAMANQFSEIELHAMVIDASPSQVLA